ncbi:AraC family transcriptional regulator [Pseudomonas cavernae]|uniref:AraC family transcriptional regulator n=1 Tax=Pseudomonas cavernae TaxID=2320867 RepID=UPI0013C44387|nr:AraC family transcriptional regulator [Pseudomonas cavernae]
MRNSLYMPLLVPALEDLLTLGVAVERVEAVFKRSLSELRQPLVYVPLLMSRRFWELAVAASGDPGIGLELGRGLLSRLPNNLTYLFDVAPSLAEGFGYFVDFLPGFYGHFEAEVLLGEDEVQVRLHDRGSLKASPAVLDYLLSGICSLVRRKVVALGLRDSPLRRVSLAHAAPAGPARHAAAWQLPVSWGQAFHALHFDRALFLRPLSPGNEGMIATLLALTGQIRQNNHPTLLVQVCDHISTHLSGDSSLESFCLQHHMTKRTVTRRLLAQGWRYSELLDAFRSYRAADLLRDPAQALVDTAEQLGYRDLPSFSRAFTRWYGRSPGAWREAELGGGLASLRGKSLHKLVPTD